MAAVMAFKNLIADWVFFSSSRETKKIIKKNAGLPPHSFPKSLLALLVLVAKLKRAPDTAKLHSQKHITQFRAEHKKFMR